MPIYEYYSPDTNKIYSFYARSLAYADKTPRCPDGKQHRMKKLVSAFAVIGRSKEPEKTPNPAGAEGADDPRMEAAMAAMEREFTGMNEENPDPRQLGRMMRRMSELSGEKMPAEMEEMTRRLEAGEDSEKLEEKFGDQFGDEEGGEMNEMGGPPGAETTETKEERAKKRMLRALARRRRAEPQRDPVLYEIADYVMQK